ncbi:MAG TPA: amino acid adenylation domain-containing protein, partial [Ktedonobacteraceae bacterium]|nr:amino acid adenylation domain-containing protein [Ktedonobacteraceae bacterium]
MSDLYNPTNQLSVEQKRKLLTQHLQKKEKGPQTFPLSFAQQRLWFLEQWEPHSPLYTLFAITRLEGLLEVEALAASLHYLVQRHASLRTTFASVNEQPVQIIHPLVSIPLRVIDLVQLQPEEQRKTVQSLLQQEEQAPFDLAEGPLLRCSLLRLGAADHTLLVAMHHIISDAWSMSIFYHELSVVYNQILAHQLHALPALSIQYADFARWQRRYLNEAILDKQLNYWREQLADAPALLNLPTDYPRPATQNFRGAWIPFDLSEHLSEQIRDLCQQTGVTLFMTLFAGLSILLARYSGQADIVIGSPIANRTRTEVEGLIGFFVNTLALRTTIPNDATVREFLLAIRDTTLEAYTHQELPFEKLVEELAPERSTSHSPLFQVLFMLQNAPTSDRQMQGIRMWSEEPESKHVMFDLTCTMMDHLGHLSGMIGYKTSLFEATTIQRMLVHFQTILEQMVSDPEQRLSNLSLLSKTQQRHLFKLGRGGPELTPSTPLVHQLFEEQARHTPEGEAVRFEERHFSYTQINSLSNQLAHTLLARHIMPGRPVLIMLSRGVLQIIGMFAILKAGCPFVCVDRLAPELRLKHVLQEVEPACIITEPFCLWERPELRSIFEESIKDQENILEISITPEYHNLTKAAWMLMANGHLMQSRVPATNPEIELHPESPAYIAYTSGSTGIPRGIVQSHRNFSHFINWFQNNFQLHAPKRVAQWPTLTFDPALAEIFSTLCFGATLCMAPESVTSDPLAVVQWIRKEQVAFLQTVPGFFRYMLHVCEQEAERNGEQRLFPDLESLILTGEVFPMDLAQTLLRSYPDQWTLYNLYGPTETILATCYAIHTLPPHMTSIPVGHPIAGCQVVILDEAGHLCPIGVAGEIYIGGSYVSHGYYRRPEETAQRFLPCPLPSVPSQERFYRTGDLGRWRSDGSLEFIGRRDLQVKIRGMRIELEEIEAALRSQEDVKQCAVTTFRDQHDEQRLVAYIVPQPAADPSTLLAEIKHALKRIIPDYMIPTAFVIQTQLPLTASGKIQRGALRPPDWEQFEREKPLVAPRNPIEDVLLTIWSDVLHRQHISIHANFFEIGGHSLLSTQVVARIRDIFQTEITVRDLFEQTTIAELAWYLDQKRQAGVALVQPPLTRRSDSKQQRIPLSFAQQRLWFLSQITTDQTLYILPMSIRLQGPLHSEALEQSMNEIIRRHEGLRTSFLLEHGEPGQSIAETVHLKLP